MEMRMSSLHVPVFLLRLFDFRLPLKKSFPRFRMRLPPPLFREGLVSLRSRQSFLHSRSARDPSLRGFISWSSECLFFVQLFFTPGKWTVP